MQIKQINQYNILVNELMYPTPLVALAHEYDKDTILLYSREVYIYSINYKEVELVYESGNIIYGRNTDRLTIVKSINNISNIKRDINFEEFVLKSEINNFLNNDSKTHIIDKISTSLPILGETNYYKEIYLEGTKYFNIIVKNVDNKYSTIQLNEFDTVIDKSTSTIYQFRSGSIKLLFSDTIEPNTPVKYSSTGTLKSSIPTEDKDVVNKEYLERYSSLLEKGTEINSFDLVSITNSISKKTYNFTINELFSKFIKNPLGISGFITSVDTIPTKTNRLNGSIYLVKSQNSLRDPESGFVFKNKDIVLWLDNSWIDIGDTDISYDLTLLKDPEKLSIINSAGSDIELPLATNEFPGLLSKELFTLLRSASTTSDGLVIRENDSIKVKSVMDEFDVVNLKYLKKFFTDNRLSITRESGNYLSLPSGIYDATLLEGINKKFGILFKIGSIGLQLSGSSLYLITESGDDILINSDNITQVVRDYLRSEFNEFTELESKVRRKYNRIQNE